MDQSGLGHLHSRHASGGGFLTYYKYERRVLSYFSCYNNAKVTRQESNTPTTQSLVHLYAEKRVGEYLQQRDRYRKNADEAAQARWAGTFLALASRCWKTYSRTFIQQNIALRHILDKYWNGCNRAKGLRGPAREEALKCVVCGGEDSQRHLILECRHEDLDDVRQQARESLLVELVNLTEDKLLEGKIQQSVARFIYEQAFNTSYPDLDRLWLGTWNCDVLRDAIAYTFYRSDLTNEIELSELDEVHLIVSRLMGHLNKAITQLQKVQGRISKQLEVTRKDENPGKRRRLLPSNISSDEHQDMEVCETENSTSKQPREKRGRRKRILKLLNQRKELGNKRSGDARSVTTKQFPNLQQEMDEVINMDIVSNNGTSNPRGETQDVDHDRD